MKSLVFDSSTVISLATNDLLWTIKPLKDAFGGSFFIPESVHEELVDNPLNSRRFKLEAIMVQRLIKENFLQIQERMKVDSLLDSINSIFFANGAAIKVVSKAEVEALALALKIEASAYVVDERTMRLLVEDPEKLRLILEGKLHTKIKMNEKGLREFKQYCRSLKILRSSELMMVALEKGVLDKFLDKEVSKRELADALLWGLRLRGCAISTEEIEDLEEMA